MLSQNVEFISTADIHSYNPFVRSNASVDSRAYGVDVILKHYVMNMFQHSILDIYGVINKDALG